MADAAGVFIAGRSARGCHAAVSLVGRPKADPCAMMQHWIRCNAGRCFELGLVGGAALALAGGGARLLCPGLARWPADGSGRACSPRWRGPCSTAACPPSRDRRRGRGGASRANGRDPACHAPASQREIRRPAGSAERLRRAAWRWRAWPRDWAVADVRTSRLRCRRCAPRAGAAAAGLSRAARPDACGLLRRPRDVAAAGLPRPDRDRHELPMTTRIPDPIADGLARGWRVLGGTHRGAPATLECDVAIIGSGAGAGITAELLSAGGPEVVIIEEGPLKSSRDFRQLESEAYPSLYQESAARKTADKAINILQGRCVGGSTTVNWTSSFRTPSIDAGLLARALRPVGDDRRGACRRGSCRPNSACHRAVAGAAEREQRSAAARRAQARHCRRRDPAQRQGLLEPRIVRPRLSDQRQAVDAGDDDPGCTRPRCDAVGRNPGRAVRTAGRAHRGAALRASAGQRRVAAGARATRIVARHYVLAGGAINSPALLMRSGAPDPHGLLGARTFLHPVVASVATFDHSSPAGKAPRRRSTAITSSTLASDRRADRLQARGAAAAPADLHDDDDGFGREAATPFAKFPNTHALLALLRDGFHAESPGGQVRLRSDGSPELDYTLTPFVMDGARRALLSMAELQFAAGRERGRQRA